MMTYEKLKPSDVVITEQDIVSLTQMGMYAEIQYMSNRNHSARNIKVSAKEYMDRETGEIKEFQTKSVTRADNANSMRKTLRKVRQLIYANTISLDNILFVTLTYSKCQSDTEEYYKDHKKFMQRFNYYLKKRDFEKPEYISWSEYQARGSIHTHILFFFKRRRPYIKNSELAKVWGYGFVTIRALNPNCDIASYFCCYITDVEIPDDVPEGFFPNEVIKTGTDGTPKRIAKGQRLNFCKSQFKMLRHSRGILYPVKSTLSYKKAREKITNTGMQLKYQEAFKISDDKGFSTIVAKQEFIKPNKK